MALGIQLNSPSAFRFVARIEMRFCASVLNIFQKDWSIHVLRWAHRQKRRARTQQVVDSPLHAKVTWADSVTPARGGYKQFQNREQKREMKFVPVLLASRRA